MFFSSERTFKTIAAIAGPFRVEGGFSPGMTECSGFSSRLFLSLALLKRSRPINGESVCKKPVRLPDNWTLSVAIILPAPRTWI
jgi:hypothetical protein